MSELSYQETYANSEDDMDQLFNQAVSEALHFGADYVYLRTGAVLEIKDGENEGQKNIVKLEGKERAEVLEKNLIGLPQETVNHRLDYIDSQIHFWQKEKKIFEACLENAK